MNIPPRLSEIAEQLKSGESPPQETVRTFIGWFGAQRRGYWIVLDIRRVLRKLNVRTKPDFDSAFIDSRISFVLDDPPTDSRKEVAPVVTETDASAEIKLGPSTPSPSDRKDPTYRIGRLVSANQVPLSVKPDSPVTEAITLMLINDYSQLPVMTTERDVKGMISWKTIGSRLALGEPAALVRECMEAANIVDATESLFSVIERIVESESVLIRSHDRTIVGIVTTSDLSVQFRQLSEPFLLLAEIENHIRGLIEGHFDASEMSAAKKESDTTRDISSVADMTFGEYIRLLENPKNWERTDLKLDRSVFIKELGRIREIRNDVMHFDSDGITGVEHETLRGFVDFLQQLQDIVRLKD